MTKIGVKRVRMVRCRGGNTKVRALRLDTGNFSWGSENTTRKCKIMDVVYNASNNELVRTETLVKNCIVQVDASLFKQWYMTRYGLDLSKKKKGAEKEKTEIVGSRHATPTPRQDDEARRDAPGAVRFGAPPGGDLFSP